MWAHRGCFFLESFSFKDCCVQECSFYFWYFSNKLASRVISIGSLSMKSFIIFLVACKAGEFCCAIDLDFQLTEIWGESKNDSKIEVDPLPALPPYTFGSRFGEKKKKKKKKRLLCRLCSLYMSATTRYLFNALFQSTVTPTLISQLHLISLHPVCC